MNCARCASYAAAPGGELCRKCEAADLHPAPAPAAAAHPAAPGLSAHTALPIQSPHGPAWLRSPVGLGRAVAILLGVVAVTDLVAVWADLVMLDVLGRMVDGEYGWPVEEDADRADRLTGLTGSAQALAYLATAVVFLIWFHRVRVNAEVFEPFGHQKKRGWAIAGWIVPVVNLWFPRRIALDSWDASSPTAKPRSHALVNAWWTMWLISGVADQVSGLALRRAETAEEIQTATERVLFADAFEIPTAVFAVFFVLALTRMQDDKARSGPGEPEPVAAL
ncbi:MULTISPECIES: DUF4328 domain-containing protein [unclassified Streptomyces]|uniref:DUF4328 domain-containing protein n=1 Tax=unclassified Streptomyces TaxID=2593676 RepID=UPI0008E8BAB8|nr:MULTISPECIES: DUF4328 domain-containing protein [unclassified Streptomyces]UJV41098.1 DUF4328 domain-containing protein [Streptomyces sp. AMCC400023]SFN23554.1 protein of unknown function [Streptomyces sp. cf124]